MDLSFIVLLLVVCIDIYLNSVQAKIMLGYEKEISEYKAKLRLYEEREKKGSNLTIQQWKTQR